MEEDDWGAGGAGAVQAVAPVVVAGAQQVTLRQAPGTGEELLHCILYCCISGQY